MERRLAVHAGANAEVIRRGPGYASSGRWRAAWVVALATVLVAPPVEARPKRRDARAAFDRGLAAYQKGSFEAASVAFSKSFELERDVDTLFAWAQAERKLEHCDQAIGLYEKILGFDLPAENRQAVEHNLEECRAVVAAQAPAPTPAPAPEAAPALAAAQPLPAPASSSPASSGRAWYRDPLALGLVGGGVLATGVGTGLLVSARSLDSDWKRAASIDEARPVREKARSRGNLGLATTAAGGALVIGGVVYILLTRDRAEHPAVTGWLTPGGGGLALSGGF